MERLVAFENEGARLYGVLGVPDSEPRGCVVFVHGWGGCRMGPHRILVKTGRELNRAGYASLRFDLRGRGDSEGDTVAADLDGMISDTCAAAKFLMSETGQAKAGVLGVCSGGNVAIGAATLMPEVRELVLWSTLPFQTHKRAADDVKKTGSFLMDYLRKASQPATWKKLIAGRVNFNMVRRVLFGHYAKPESEDGGNPKDSSRDIMAALETYPGRMLFVYGGADPEAAGAREVYEAFAKEHGLDAAFQVVEGANHSFYSHDWKREVIERSLGWLA